MRTKWIWALAIMRRRSFLGSLVGAAMCIVAPILAPGRPWEWGDFGPRVCVFHGRASTDWTDLGNWKDRCVPRDGDTIHVVGGTLRMSASEFEQYKRSVKHETRRRADRR